VSYYSNNQQHYKKRSSIRTTSVAKIVEIVGSDKRWKDAAKVAVKEAMKTLRGIHGIEVS
jgi:flavin-binding protein dodecin